MQAIPPSWESLFGELVVLDLESRYVAVGTLVELQGDYLLLSELDMHDLRDTTTTRDQYVLQCARDGMTANRRWAWVKAESVVGLSRLADVIVE